MQLVFLDTLKNISGYADIRSVRTWLAGMQIPLLRIGKNYAVDAVLFEKRISERYRLTQQKTGYKPKQETEKAFLTEVDHLLSSTRTV